MKKTRMVRVRFINGAYYISLLTMNEYYTLICLMELTELEKEVKGYEVFKYK